MKTARPQRKGRLPGIVPSVFSSILGLCHHSVTRGHHGQWNDWRKCTVRPWNHGWGAEDVWSSSWTVESWRQWRRILEEYMRTVQRLTLLMGCTRMSCTLYCQLFKTCLQSSRSLTQDKVCMYMGLSIGTTSSACYSLVPLKQGSPATIVYRLAAVCNDTGKSSRFPQRPHY
jgi:hypothetical protein